MKLLSIAGLWIGRLRSVVALEKISNLPGDVGTMKMELDSWLDSLYITY